MTDYPRIDEDEERDIPEYRALVALDMKGYSSTPDHGMQGLREDFDDIVASAVAESGLGSEWTFHGPERDRGDGCIAVMPVRKMWRLIDPFPENLDRALARYDRVRRAITAAIRVRMSVHVGPVNDSVRCDAINDVCRLLDSSAARDAVAKAEELDSYVALVVSDPVFRVVVRSQRAPRLRQRDFLPARAEVPRKYSEIAWVHVPRRSPADLSAGAAAPAEEKEATPASAGTDEAPPVPGPATPDPAAGTAGTSTVGKAGAVIHGGRHEMKFRQQF